MRVVVLKDQALVFVVRKDGEPGIYLAPGLFSKGDAAELLDMMAGRLRQEAEEEAAPDEGP